MKTNEYNIHAAYIAYIEACLHKYKSMPVIFFCDASQSCRLRKVLHSYNSRLAVIVACWASPTDQDTSCTSTKEYLMWCKNWSCRLRKCLCSYKEDAHTVAWWVSPYWPRHIELQSGHTHTLWLGGCLLLTNCKTHLALLFVVQTVAG